MSPTQGTVGALLAVLVTACSVGLLYFGHARAVPLVWIVAVLVWVVYLSFAEVSEA